jgi:hypothetical protein
MAKEIKPAGQSGVLRQKNAEWYLTELLNEV